MNAWRALTLATFSLLAALPLPAAEEPVKRSPDEVLLVANERSRISKSVADDYAQERQIRNRIFVQCVDSAVDFVGWQDVIIGDPPCAPYRDRANPDQRPGQ